MRKIAILAMALAAAACGSPDNGGNGSNGATSQSKAGKGEQAKANLLQALAGSADHKVLANAIQAAGLNETLSGAQPYTLFGPTDAAFQKAGGANALLAPDAKGELVALLTAHIVPGIVTGEDLERAIERGKGKAQLATMAGGTLSFARDGDAIVVTDAKGGQARVDGEDLDASNGVVHSLDGVLSGR
ncbi:MAG TPA: fasciclin domain-containing protein [Allosphingosinicella sp.]|nr:fasciclin domain-containing protein [Allosphingosinicella sp.]